MDEEELRARLQALVSPRAAGEIVALSRPAIRLHTSAASGAQSRIGGSRVGGAPDLPEALTWPTWWDRPQGFVAQVNLAEVASSIPNSDLPPEGMLYFFYDLWEQPWGFDPRDRGGAAVIYSPDDAGLVRRPAQAEALDPGCAVPFAPCAVTYAAVLSPPSWFSERLDRAQMSEAERDRYSEWWLDTVRESGPLHQLLGLPYLIQGDMEVQCQLASNGVYLGEPHAWTDPQHEPLRAGAANWRLLFQVDSDEAPGMLWGTGGMIYYWIRREDLLARRFDDTWLVLQNT